MARRTFIGIGSNMGDAAGRCEEAMGRIVVLPRVGPVRRSSLYMTSPVSEIPQDDFINAAAAFDWDRPLLELLGILKEIERAMGRVKAPRNGPRAIDLDILLSGDLLLESPELIVPHPRLHLRRFALIPCIEIDPGLRHPLSGVPLTSYLAAIPGSQQVRILRPAGIPPAGKA